MALYDGLYDGTRLRDHGLRNYHPRVHVPACGTVAEEGAVAKRGGHHVCRLAFLVDVPASPRRTVRSTGLAMPNKH